MTVWRSRRESNSDLRFRKLLVLRSQTSASKKRAKFFEAVAKSLKNGAPEEIRTPDPQIRSLVLYPAELRALLPAVGPNGPRGPGIAIGSVLRWQVRPAPARRAGRRYRPRDPG